MNTLTITLIIIIALAIIIALMFNNLVGLNIRCQNAWSQIDNQLKRRYDLIPNLVEVTKGYAAHERETLVNVVNARNTNASMSEMAKESETVSQNVKIY